jgi:hypothetical protein
MDFWKSYHLRPGCQGFVLFSNTDGEDHDININGWVYPEDEGRKQKGDGREKGLELGDMKDT